MYNTCITHVLPVYVYTCIAVCLYTCIPVLVYLYTLFQTPKSSSRTFLEPSWKPFRGHISARLAVSCIRPWFPAPLRLQKPGRFGPPTRKRKQKHQKRMEHCQCWTFFKNVKSMLLTQDNITTSKTAAKVAKNKPQNAISMQFYACALFS